jgi:hypothetical protein
MSKLSDEEKAKAILGNVEEPAPAEPTEDEELEPEELEPETSVETQTEEPETPGTEAGESEVETPEAEEEPAKPFTKLFPNLKGDTPEEYAKEVETAYTNSTNEALRLKKIIDDNAAIVEQANQVIARAGIQPTPPADPANPETAQVPVAPVAPTAPAAPTNPDLEWVKQEREAKMIEEFGKFKKDYPQAVDKDNFQTFLNTSKGVDEALTARLGRRPSYQELYKGIADILGWQPMSVEAKKNNAIKGAGASSRPSTTTPPLPKKSKVTSAQVDMHLKLFPFKSREQAVKDLAEVIG